MRETPSPAQSKFCEGVPDFQETIPSVLRSLDEPHLFVLGLSANERKDPHNLFGRTNHEERQEHTG